MTDFFTQKYHGKNALRIFVTLMAAYAFFTNHYLTTNDASRFALTMAVVETGSPCIGTLRNGQVVGLLRNVTHPAWLVKDYAAVGHNVYSDKAPLPSFLAMPGVVWFTSLFTAGLFTALAALTLYRLSRFWARDEFRAVLISLTYGLGTMALFYGAVFFSHGITAFCCIASFYFLAKVQLNRGGAGSALLGGLLAGAAFTCDYFSAISTACLLGYAAWGRKNVLSAFLGCAVPVMLLLLYNQWTFGAPWPLSYSYANLYGSLHSKGLYGITFPDAENAARLWKLLFSRWGFFFTNLMVIFSIYSFRRFMVFRRPAALVLAMAAGYLYLNSCQGWLDAYSARFLLPLLPFLMIPIVFVEFSNRWMRNTFFLLLGFSIVINFVGADCHLREYQGWACRPGMNNLAAYFLESRGLTPGFRNYLFVVPFMIVPWLIPAVRKGKSPEAGRENERI